MKGIAIAIISLVLVGTAAEAQSNWAWDKQKFHSAKAPQVEQRITSPSYCYDTGWEFGFYGTGSFPDDSFFDNSFGGGFTIAYFFGHNFGIDGSYSFSGSGVAEQVGTLNFVYRFPLGGECCSTIAPYIMGGPGFVSSGQQEFLWNVGGGIDFRFESWGCTSLFTDYSWNFVDDKTVLSNFGLLRLGMRFPF